MRKWMKLVTRPNEWVVPFWLYPAYLLLLGFRVHPDFSENDFVVAALGVIVGIGIGAALWRTPQSSTTHQ